MPQHEEMGPHRVQCAVPPTGQGRHCWGHTARCEAPQHVEHSNKRRIETDMAASRSEVKDAERGLGIPGVRQGEGLNHPHSSSFSPSHSFPPSSSSSTSPAPRLGLGSGSSSTSPASSPAPQLRSTSPAPQLNFVVSPLRDRAEHNTGGGSQLNGSSSRVQEHSTGCGAQHTTAPHSTMDEAQLKSHQEIQTDELEEAKHRVRALHHKVVITMLVTTGLALIL